MIQRDHMILCGKLQYHRFKADQLETADGRGLINLYHDAKE